VANRPNAGRSVPAVNIFAHLIKALHPRVVALALIGLVCSPGLARATERWETLEAIHRIENPFDTARPGRGGELGPYQFRAATWRMHTAVPFARAVERPVSDAVAIRHYEWLKGRLARHGLPTTPYNIALAWNAGITAVVRGRVPAATQRYAERATNIVGELKRIQVAALH
jgi:hypothetical protein